MRFLLTAFLAVIAATWLGETRVIHRYYPQYGPRICDEAEEIPEYGETAGYRHPQNIHFGTKYGETVGYRQPQDIHVGTKYGYHHPWNMKNYPHAYSQKLESHLHEASVRPGQEKIHPHNDELRLSKEEEIHPHNDEVFLGKEEVYSHKEEPQVHKDELHLPTKEIYHHKIKVHPHTGEFYLHKEEPEAHKEELHLHKSVHPHSDEIYLHKEEPQAYNEELYLHEAVHPHTGEVYVHKEEPQVHKDELRTHNEELHLHKIVHPPEVEIHPYKAEDHPQGDEIQDGELEKIKIKPQEAVETAIYYGVIPELGIKVKYHCPVIPQPVQVDHQIIEKVFKAPEKLVLTLTPTEKPQEAEKVEHHEGIIPGLVHGARRFAEGEEKIAIGAGHALEHTAGNLVSGSEQALEHTAGSLIGGAGHANEGTTGSFVGRAGHLFKDTTNTLQGESSKLLTGGRHLFG